jgi:hypothetical protein
MIPTLSMRPRHNDVRSRLRRLRGRGSSRDLCFRNRQHNRRLCSSQAECETSHPCGVQDHRLCNRRRIRLPGAGAVEEHHLWIVRYCLGKPLPCPAGFIAEMFLTVTLLVDIAIQVILRAGSSRPKQCVTSPPPPLSPFAIRWLIGFASCLSSRLLHLLPPYFLPHSLHVLFDLVYCDVLV